MAKKYKGPRYVAFFHWMLDSRAWKDLDPTARALYIELSKRYNGRNNGGIGYSVRNAANDLKIGKTTATRAFNDLQAHGFIVAEQRGHFHWKINPNGSRIRPASEWRLTIFENDRTNNLAARLATKEFMRWPEIQNAVPPQVRMVPDTGPHGTQYGTMRMKKRPDGIRYRTMKAISGQ